VLAIAVWCEPDHVNGFRARVSTVDTDGHLSVLGVTTDNTQATALARQWLQVICDG
jgi:hypothetical protein